MATNINSRISASRVLLNGLATTRCGRIALHLVCFIRNPGHRQWHWQGMLREFAR